MKTKSGPGRPFPLPSVPPSAHGCPPIDCSQKSRSSLPSDDDILDDADRCLLRDSALLALTQPDAAGYLHRRANISGWYRYWFTLHGSQLNYYDVTASSRRGPLAGTISLFRNTVAIAAPPKRARELDLTDFAGKTHALRSDSDAQLHWWMRVFASARNKIPPAKPFGTPARGGGGGGGSGSVSGSVSGGIGGGAGVVPLPPISCPNGATFQPRPGGGGGGGESGTVQRSRSFESAADRAPSLAQARTAAAEAAAEAFEAAADAAAEPTPRAVAEAQAQVQAEAQAEAQAQAKQQPQAQQKPGLKKVSLSVDDHLRVDHVLCVVHGIGVDEETLADNIKTLQMSYLEIVSRIFPDLTFNIEILVVRWRNALTNLDVHRKLQSVVPIAPLVSGESNPLRQFMVHRLIDYIYYTHDRYRRHIMREITAQLNANVADFRRRRPDFDGHISVYAHSLGAALCYDLLTRRVNDDQSLLAAEGMRIDFEVANLFLCGSPLGTFLHLDPSLAMGTSIQSLPFRVLNIFHPNDPIATRLEPYIDDRYCGVRPVLIPYWLNMGIRSSTAQWLGTLWSGGAGKKEKAAAAAAAAAVGKSQGNDASMPENRPENRAENTPSSANASTAAAVIGIQPSLGRFGIGKDLDSKPSSSGPNEDSSSGAGPDSFSGVVGGTAGNLGVGGVPVSYFPEAAQQEVISSAQLPHRLDFSLQLASTMEEVSTSWSALRAHTDYWGNRDMMLLLLSSMIKTTHGIPDNVSRLPSLEADQHLIDARVGVKETRVGSGWSDREAYSSAGAVKQTPGGEDSACTLDQGVAEFVTKIVDESAAMHGLMTHHPNVRMRMGGITRSTSKPKGSDASEAARKAANTPSGWASYLPWFGGSAASSEGKTPAAANGASRNGNQPVQKTASSHV